MSTNRILGAGVVAAISLLTASALAQKMTVIEDFSSQPKLDWRYVADGVMGGVSQGKANLDSEVGDGFVRLQGQVSTDNNGGFIQVRANLKEPLSAGIKGLSVEAKGNNKTYHVFAKTTDARRPWHSYRATFEVGSNWRSFDLAFADFKPSNASLPPDLKPEKIVSVAIVAYGRDFNADVSVSKLTVY